LELRHKIWYYAAHHPRAVNLIKDGAINAGRTSRVTGQSKQPAILQANRESRAEGRKYYELCSQKQITTHDKWYDGVLCGTRSWNPDSFYINFSVDTFELPHVPFDDEDSPRTGPTSHETYNYPLDVLERIELLKVIYNAKTSRVSDPLNHPLDIFVFEAAAESIEELTFVHGDWMREVGFHTVLGDLWKSDVGDNWTQFLTEDQNVLRGWSLMEETKVNYKFTASIWEGLEGHDLDPCPAVMKVRGGEISLHIWEGEMFFGLQSSLN
jgi:hypothetical protein